MENQAEHLGLVKRFRSQSDEEYVEFLGKCRDFHTELDRERKQKHFTFAELDENEAELAKLRSWLPKISTRDFFGGRFRGKAQKALLSCQRDLAQFSREVEGQQTELPPIQKKRR